VTVVEPLPKITLVARELPTAIDVPVIVSMVFVAIVFEAVELI
jgi:hypothetical protein